MRSYLFVAVQLGFSLVLAAQVPVPSCCEMKITLDPVQAGVIEITVTYQFTPDFGPLSNRRLEEPVRKQAQARRIATGVRSERNAADTDRPGIGRIKSAASTVRNGF